MEFPKKYDPNESEKKWLDYWVKEKVYAFNQESKKEFFSIDTPPPTVSGKMHVGHAYSYSQQDFIARYKRMKGYEVFFPFGTDDNGLATERLIEKTKKVKSKKMPRDEFVKLCLETLKEIRPDFIADWKKLGISCDYELFYSTINNHCQKLSQESFIELYEKGLEYRKHAPIIFCPHCKTAIAQVEMEDKQEKSSMNYIKAKMNNGQFVLYATTRPELLYGCIGISLDQDGDYVLVESNGEEWITSKDSVEKLKKWFSIQVKKEFKGKSLVGEEVTIPISKIKVKISHDEVSRTDLGTGIVYYCSYGGMDCIEWLPRHPETQPIHVMGLEGTYNEKCELIKGKNSLEARKIILEELKNNKSLLKVDPISHVLNVHERCGTGIEYVALKQWFIKVLDQQKLWLESGNKLNWAPEHMKNRYDNWIHGLKWDWCISRQRHFGIPIPVWYCEKCDETIVATKDQLPVDPLKDKPNNKCKCGHDKVRPENDVLDTWATSSLTPQLAINLVPQIKDKIYPMNLRSNGPDIINFWLFNTVVKSQLHNKVNPWKDVAITGWVLDQHGRKMSKSKGNVVDPREVWDKHSVDAIRFSAGETKLGSDYPYQEKDVLTGKKTVTKLFNASKFSFMHLEDFDKNVGKDKFQGFDAWLTTKLNKVIETSTKNFDKYSYSRAKNETDKFFWLNFCDVYLEVVKDRLYNPDKRGMETRRSGQKVLHNSLLNILKLYAPFLPYITEDLFQNCFAKDEKLKSIHISKWPEGNKTLINEEAEKIGDALVEVISAVRKAKSEKGVSLKEPVKELTIALTEKEVMPFLDDLRAVTKAEKISFEQELCVTL